MAKQITAPIGSNGSSIIMANVRNPFNGTLPGVETAILPDNRTSSRNASFFYRCEPTSILAKVQKSHRSRRSTCQDTAFAAVYNEFILAGVLDGCGDFGHVLSNLIAEKLIELSYETRMELAASPDLSSLLKSAVSRALANLDIPGDNAGSTVIVLLLLPNNTFCIASLGDSAAYIISKNGVKRLLNFNRLLSFIDAEVLATDLDIAYYLKICSNLVTCVSKSRIFGDIELAEGKIEPGDRILLGSDGLTHNLSIRIDPRSERILDLSGCDDIEAIVKPGADIRVSGQQLLELINLRINDCYREKHIDTFSEVIISSDDDRAIVLIGRD